MAENDNNLSDTVPQEPELSSGVGLENVSDEDVLKVVEETTGRKYASVAEAKKGLKETFAYVGKAGQYEKIVKTIAEKLDLGDEKGVSDWLKNLEEPAPAQVRPVEEKVADLEFQVSHPELKEHLPIIKKLAKADGISLDEAVKTDFFQDYLKTKASQKEGQPSSIIESNQRVGFQTDEIKPLVEEVKKTDDLGAKQKLVEKVLGLGK